MSVPTTPDPEPRPRFTGIVLTGGRSRRMGTDKAFLVPDDGGPPLVLRARSALAVAGAVRILAVGGPADRLAGMGFETVEDRAPDEGPLIGLITGLRAAQTRVAVVLTCDMPLIDGATVSRLVDGLADGLVGSSADAAMPVAGGRRQVLTAAYRVAAVDRLDAAARAGERSVHRALAGLVVVEVAGTEAWRLRDLDRPADVDHYARNNRVLDLGPTGSPIGGQDIPGPRPAADHREEHQ